MVPIKEESDTLDIIKVRAVHQKTFKRVKRQAIEWEIFVIQIYLIKDSYPKYIFLNSHKSILKKKSRKLNGQKT